MNARWIAILLLTIVSPLRAGAEFLEDVEYKRIPPQSVETGKKIEVREFFWYGCSHCYALEPYLEKWRKKIPRNVQLVRTPGVFNERWAIHARSYYAFEAMGITDKVHGALFRAIHVDKQRLFDPASIAAFVGKHGGDSKAFLDAYGSFGVQASVNRAMQAARAVNLDSVPTIVVDGKFVTNANIAGGYERVTTVIDHLIKKAIAERAGKK